MLRQVGDGVSKPRASALPAPFLWEWRSPNAMAGGVFKSPGEPARRAGGGSAVSEQEVAEEGSGAEEQAEAEAGRDRSQHRPASCLLSFQGLGARHCSTEMLRAAVHPPPRPASAHTGLGPGSPPLYLCSCAARVGSYYDVWALTGHVFFLPRLPGLRRKNGTPASPS